MTRHAPAKTLLPRLQQSALHAFTPLQREFHRVFDEMGEGWDAFTGLRMAPVMDAVETKGGLELTIELPGLTRDQITVTVDEDLLTVSGEKTSGHDPKGRTAHVLERSYGEFSRSIYLPRSVDGGMIQASMADGVLKIFAPRRPEVKTKKIPIRST